MSDRSERELRESIESTRARMGDTIEQIGDRVNPDRVKADLKARARNQIHEATDNVKRKARNTMRDVQHGVTDTGRGIWATIRENPLPVGMVGVGLAWLFANRRSDASRQHEYGSFSTGESEPYRAGYVGTRYDEPVAGSETTGRIEHGYEGTQPDTRFAGAAGTQPTGDGGAHGIRAKASEVAHLATDRISEMQERVGGLTHEARIRALSAERRVEESLQENPMAAGALALAFGVAAGLMIPGTEKEHQLLGQRRDRVLERAQRAASTAGQRIHEAARDAAGESARRAVDEMWPQGTEGQPGFSEGQAGFSEGQQGFTEPRR